MSVLITSVGMELLLNNLSGHLQYCGLYDSSNVELTYVHYERQPISWTYDIVTTSLVSTLVVDEDFSAQFNVPATVIKYVGFFNLSGQLICKVDLGSDAKTYTDIGLFEIVEISIDPLLALLEV